MGHGFIILIAVICELNIFNTVWADIEGKRREIALLRAVGMDTKTLVGYLYGGCLMYAIGGMLPGALIGYLILYAAIEVLKNYLFISLFNPATILLATFAVTLVLTNATSLTAKGAIRHTGKQLMTMQLTSGLGQRTI